MKITRETLRSANPYAVVEKIEEVTGERLKAVTGYNSTYLTVKVKRKMSKVEQIACETGAHPK